MRTKGATENETSTLMVRKEVGHGDQESLCFAPRLGNSSEAEAFIWLVRLYWIGILQLQRANGQGVGVQASVWAGYLVPQSFLLSDSDPGVSLDAVVDREQFQSGL